MTATIKFRTQNATDWIITKKFVDRDDCDSFISHICKTKSYYLDELFLEDGVLKDTISKTLVVKVL